MLHETTFEYLKPTDEQIESMATMRRAYADFVSMIDDTLPNGADKTYIIRKLRECAMWTNVAITRTADGEPRK